MQIKDPYSELIEIMKQQGAKYNPPAVQLGKVVSTSPLAVKTADIQLNKSNLLVADYLLSGYTRTVSTSVFSGSQKFTDGLKKNDTLVLVQIDISTFLVLCKVVTP